MCIAALVSFHRDFEFLLDVPVEPMLYVLACLRRLGANGFLKEVGINDIAICFELGLEVGGCRHVVQIIVKGGLGRHRVVDASFGDGHGPDGVLTGLLTCGQLPYYEEP